MAGQSVGAVYVDALINNKSFNKQVNSTVKGAEKSFTGAFGRIGAAIGAALSVAAVGAFAKASVQAAMQAESAFMGLNSQLSAQGRSYSEATKFLQEFTADGLVPMTNAANAYKQLASRGFDDSQIRDMMNATKDMATYNRQAHYSMGEAVEVFAQGLKNEESTLTDAAGMTKNLSIIWDEYAQTIGKTGATLTQAEKVQAEYLATMNEWQYSMGNAAKMSSTFQGRLAALKGTLSSIKTEIGNVIIPIIDLFMPALQAAANAVLNFITKIKQLLAVFGLEMQEIGGGTGAAETITSGMDTAAESASGAADAIGSTGKAATAAAKAVKRALAPYDELNRLTFAKDSGGSSGSDAGGGVGGAGSVSSAVKDTGADKALDGKVAAMSDTLKRFLDPLKNISFDNLLRAFAGLKEAAVGLGGTIWDGLEWAYFNLLVPLAEWTIEDLLPAFFYALGGALEAIDGILEEVGPALDWLWQNFLKPIATWTGGVIVDSLYALGKALKWVGDNADIAVAGASGLLGGFAAFKGLQVAGSVIDFVKYAGALSGSTTVWGSISAALAQLWTYFKGSAIVTKFTGAISGLSTAFTGVAAALGISAGALAAIIAAVAAVIAAIVLLALNWEEVCAWCKQAWDDFSKWIVKAWDDVIAWFKNLPETIRAYFDELVNKINSIDWYQIGLDAGKKIGEGIGKIIDWIEETWANVKQWFKDLPGKVEKAWADTQKWFEELPGKIIDTIENAIDWFGEVKKWFKDVGQACVDGIIEGWQAIKTAVGDFCTGFIDGIKEGLGIHSPSPVFSEIAGFCIDGLKNGLLGGEGLISNAWKTVKGWFSGDGKKDGIVAEAKVKVTQKWSDIKGSWESLTGNIKDKTANMKAKVGTTWNNIKSAWTNTTQNVKDKTASMKAKVGTVWNNIKNAWSNTTKNIKDKTVSMKAKIGSSWSQLKGKWNSLIQNFKDKTVTVTMKIKSVISDMKSWVNSNVIKKINKYVPFVKIPYLAQGGWLPANAPQLAVVGDNRREGEIVAPESKIREQVKQAMQELGMNGGPAVVRLEIAMPDGRVIIKEINRAQKEAGKVLLLT